MMCIAVLRLWLRLNSKALSSVELDHDEEILTKSEYYLIICNSC